MKKKILYIVPLASVGFLALIGNNAVSVEATGFEYKIPNTTIQMDYYDVDGANKEFNYRDVIERNDNLSIKTITTSFIDDDTKELKVCYKTDYKYDNNGNLIQKDDFAMDEGTWVPNGKDTFEYNTDNNLVLQKEYYKATDNTLKPKKEYEYIYNGQILNSYKEYLFGSDGTKDLSYLYNYEYNAKNELIKETRYFYSAYSSGCIFEYEYNEDGTLKSYKLDSFSDLNLTNRSSSYTYSYEYSGDKVTETIKELNGDVYEYYRQTVTTDNEFVNEQIMYFANGDSWDFLEGYKYAYTYNDGKLASASWGEYDNETDLDVYEEVIYTHMELPAKNDGAKKGSPVGAIIGGILGGLFLIFCGLFYFWKKELKKAIEDGDKNDRRLKIFDVIYRPINRIIFGKDKDPFDVE